MFITETWLTENDLSPISELLPTNCGFFSCPRKSKKGGGVAVIFKNSFKCRQIPAESFDSFEAMLCKVESPCSLLIAVIYRPPNSKSAFLSDFSEFLSDILTRNDNLLIVGDFNIHLCCPAKPLVNEFVQLMDSFNLKQSVSGPTHKLGHILDLVLSSGFLINDIYISDTGLSDHWPVVFDCDLPISCSSVYQPPSFLARSLNSATASNFKDLFVASVAGCTNSAAQVLDVEDLVTNFNASCTEVLNKVAPLKVKKKKTK